MEQKTSKLWGCDGRFARQMNDNLAQLNNSLHIDKRLVQEDIFGSFAYSKSLCQAQIIQPNELEMIQSALYEISNEWKNGTVVLKDDDEDIHSANERLLIEKIGNVGRKIHTGRSRNDQVILDMKLWIKKAISDILEIFSTFLNVIIEKAEENIDILMPGYTHLQRAQPIRVSHWLLSYGFFFQADCERLKQIFERVNLSMPLGSGAISGNPFEIDRIELAKNLNFRGVTMNSMNAVSDRDFVCEFNFVASMISIHLSRLSEDLILYSTKEFNYIKLSNEFCTGSSLMPQKFNADSIELVRGTTGSIIGQLMNILTTLKGLPSTYNKDLQGDKESMFYVYDKIILSLKVMVGVIDTLEIFKENCWNALSYDMLATDLAYYLVRKGKAFRDAHHCASAVVDVASKSGVDINKLPLTAFKMVSESFNEDVYNIFSFEKSVEQYQIIGGTSKTSVLEQIAHLKEFAANLKC
ncbi:hypothetical protein PVAND_004424 [Polypedilum vanderplanki]|uniref:Argininosuccinate lyase n=1 Tax=Polypedilum vanderplanki TaxID=319348 RepID=A0A9J6BZ33_POLVA|nr:hypothetical protein PVAND_004424 [Polypedilum vanderplanki]